MRVQKLWMKNFRGFSELELEFDEKVNVLVGINGAGKSSILDCLAILLSRVSTAVMTPKASGRQFAEVDIKNRTPATSNAIAVYFEGAGYRWNVAKTRRGKPQEESSSIQDAKGIASMLQARFASDESASLPLFIYYPVNRAVLDIPLRIKATHVFDQISAYEGGLTGTNNFRVFFEWFRNREDIENERFRKLREDGLSADGSAYLDPQLSAVRMAIATFLPGFTKLQVKRSPLRMTIEKDGKELIINQLSDGEKCTLAMVGDLARRLAIANPGMENPLQGRGIVLIDEVDLHMHPGWQRMVVPSLAKTFENCQFIISTHSPQVLSEVSPKSIWMISPDMPDAPHPDGAYGLDSNRILEDVMLVPERPQEVKDLFDALFHKIDRGELRQAMDDLAALRTTIGDDPELTKAEILIRRKGVLGR